MSEIYNEGMRRLDQSLGYVEQAINKLSREKVWVWVRPRSS